MEGRARHWRIGVVARGKKISGVSGASLERDEDVEHLLREIDREIDIVCLDLFILSFEIVQTAFSKSTSSQTASCIGRFWSRMEYARHLQNHSHSIINGISKLLILRPPSSFVHFSYRHSYRQKVALLKSFD